MMANTEEKRVWGIHTMDDSLFINKNVVAIGWKEFGDCSKLEPLRGVYKKHYTETYPNCKAGAMREGDYGLFVTLSNYTKNAQRYLENTPVIRGMNGAELAELILKYYDQLSEKYRRMIPLKMVYIPVLEET